MKVPLSWLQEFAPISGTPDEIAAQLTELGMELESITVVGEGLEGVVVARVLDVREHPDADRIRLVDVDRGDGVALQICCGATNMTTGDLVPLATIGTIMPSGMEIAKRKMRGQESNGMLCSAAELELGDDHGGILILGDGLEPGDAISDALELTSDVVYEFDSLPNRPDTLSIMGVARDLAARQGVPFAVPGQLADVADVGAPGASAAERCSVQIVDTDLCGRFVVRVLSDVTVGPSPRWLAQRLVAAGMRPINNVVDVSNYVMVEFGQPNHTYDLAKLPSGEVAVRWARDGETIVTLDGVERRLQASDGVIADADDRPIGIAGVMGGASTEISDSTTEICLELAWWNPDAVAATSARLSLHSEASLRFKRGVDPTIAPLAARRFAALLAEVSDAQLHPGTVDVTGDLPEPVTVPVRIEAVNALLGTSLSGEQISTLLTPIGFSSELTGTTLSVAVPSWRPDCSIEVDVIEEIARHHGYANLTRTVPVSPHTGELTATQRDRRVLRNVLAGAGLSEAMPMPFLAPGDLERCGLAAGGLVLANPLAAEESILRTSLLPGLLAAVAHNERHRQLGVQLYELGRVFALGDQGVITDVAASELAGRVLSGEAEHLAVVLAGVEAPAAVRLVERLIDSVHRGPVSLRAEELPGLHPGRSAVVQAGEAVVGQVGEVDPGVLERLEIDERVAWVQLDLADLLALAATVPIAASVSRYPSTDIDLAFVVADDVPASAVRASIRSAAGELLASLDLFDVFRSDQLGGSSRSLAFRLRLQAGDRTLTDAEVATVREGVIDAVSRAHGATLRT